MSINSVLLPKLTQLDRSPNFIKNLYDTNQCNHLIDPMWVGVAVVLNHGAQHLLSNTSGSPAWSGVLNTINSEGGLDGRIGIVTQYSDSEALDFRKRLYGEEEPWVRVSCYIERDHGDGTWRTCHSSSISIDARYVTTIPMSLYDLATQAVAEADAEMRRFADEVF